MQENFQTRGKYKRISFEIKSEAFYLYEKQKNQPEKLLKTEEMRLQYLIDSYNITKKDFFNWTRAGGIKKKTKRSGQRAHFQQLEKQIVAFIHLKKQQNYGQEIGFLPKFEFNEFIQALIKQDDQHDYSDFKASTGWEARFLQRNQLSSKIFSKEKDNKKKIKKMKKIAKQKISLQIKDPQLNQEENVQFQQKIAFPDNNHQVKDNTNENDVEEYCFCKVCQCMNDNNNCSQKQQSYDNNKQNSFQEDKIFFEEEENDNIFNQFLKNQKNNNNCLDLLISKQFSNRSAPKEFYEDNNEINDDLFDPFSDMNNIVLMDQQFELFGNSINPACSMDTQFDEEATSQEIEASIQNNFYQNKIQIE